MQRITPINTNPQPTVPVPRSTIAPIVIAPVSSQQTRPVMTPILAGGRAPIPVQIPKAVPTVVPVLPPPIRSVIPIVPVAVPRPVVSPVAQRSPVTVVRPVIPSPVPIARPVVPAVRSPITTIKPVLPVSSVAVRTPHMTQPIIRSPPQQVVLRINSPQRITERPLGEWQLEWFARAKQILASNYGYIDTSQPGAGKTSVALWIAKTYNLPMLVITEASIVGAGVWPREAKLANASHLLLEVLSYNTLAGKKFKQPSHPYLTSLDKMTEGGIVQTHFFATDYFKNIAARGCLLIFDEFSNLKNTSRKLKASFALLSSVIIEGGSSRYALLSGTPFDKEGHATNILKALRYIRAPRLYYKDPVSKQVTLEGLQELITACRAMDAPTTDRIVAEYNIDAMGSDMSQSLVYDLYTNVIKIAISGSMVAPPMEGIYEQYNGFFNINPQDAINLKRGIDALATAVSFDVRTGEIVGKKKSFGNVTPALRIIESAKIADMIRVARSYLERFPTMKVIMGVNYTETVDALMQGLAAYNPIQFDGRIKGKRRVDIEDNFRNLPHVRVLIGNLRVIGKGLSFQGLTPDALRLTILSPSYNLLDISQAAYRTNRAGKKGDAYVYIFYGRGADIELETRILDAMVRKSEVVKGTLDENGNQLRLPGEYTSYYEA
jgi:hypothetical protein